MATTRSAGRSVSRRVGALVCAFFCVLPCRVLPALDVDAPLPGVSDLSLTPTVDSLRAGSIAWPHFRRAVVARRRASVQEACPAWKDGEYERRSDFSPVVRKVPYGIRRASSHGARSVAPHHCRGRYARTPNHPSSASRCQKRRLTVHTGGRVRARGNGARPRRSPRCAIDEAGNRDRLVEGTPRWCEATSKERNLRSHAQAGETRHREGSQARTQGFAHAFARGAR